MSLRKCTMVTCNCKLRRCLLADTSANHMTQSLGTLVPHLVQILYSIVWLAIIHMCQDPRVPRAVQYVHRLFTLGSQRMY